MSLLQNQIDTTCVLRRASYVCLSLFCTGVLSCTSGYLHQLFV